MLEKNVLVEILPQRSDEVNVLMAPRYFASFRQGILGSTIRLSTSGEEKRATALFFVITAVRHRKNRSRRLSVVITKNGAVELMHTAMPLALRMKLVPFFLGMTKEASLHSALRGLHSSPSLMQ